MELYPVFGQALAAEASQTFRDLEREPRTDGPRGRSARTRRRDVFSLRRAGDAGCLGRWRPGGKAEAAA